MAFAEDMTVFFNTAEFAVTAVFVPVGKAPQTAAVLFDSPTEALFGNDVLSDEFVMTYASTDLPSVRAGDLGTINGEQYRIRDIRMQDDGKLKQAKLSKV